MFDYGKYDYEKLPKSDITNITLVRIVGYCLSGSVTAGSDNHNPVIYFNPDNTWIEVS